MFAKMKSCVKPTSTVGGMYQVVFFKRKKPKIPKIISKICIV